MNKKIILFLVLSIFCFVVFLMILIWFVIKSPQLQNQQQEIFTVALKTNEAAIIDGLQNQGFIRYNWVFNLILSLKATHRTIQPGGYYLTKSMNAWVLANKLTGLPDLKWVVITEGMRKEQIGEILAKTFNWTDEELNKWNTVYTAMKYDYLEGVYFPDTYLIPVSENGLEIANRFTSHFNETFAPYIEEFVRQNILWTTGLKLASLIQREAGGSEDMKIISGILWNRLEQNMKLQIDATAQYAKGKTGDKWWSNVEPEDLHIDSPYNTYLYKGLPPRPICNPGLEAIRAVLHPAETDCLFYLHDSNKQIHCSKSYEEHLENIKKYLQ